MATLQTVASAGDRLERADNGAGDLETQSHRGAVLARANWCYRCHGWEGISDNPGIPNLAGQKAAYLVRQLERFREGSSTGGEAPLEDAETLRIHRAMFFSADRVDEEGIWAVAVHYARKPCQPDLLGSQILRGGEPDNVPTVIRSCAACHGEAGVSLQQTVPNLAGQNALYLEKQILAFLSPRGASDAAARGRDWRHHPAMRLVAGSLTAADIRAIARHYGSQTCARKPALD